MTFQLCAFDYSLVIIHKRHAETAEKCRSHIVGMTFHRCRKMNYFLIRKLSAGNNICRQHSAYNTRTAAAQTSRHRYLTVLSYSVTLLLITYIVEKFCHCAVNQIACILWDKALSIFVDYFKSLGNFLNHHSVIQTNSHTESIKTCTHICTGCRHS